MQLSLPDEAWEGRLETIYCTIILPDFAIDFSHFLGIYPCFPSFFRYAFAAAAKRQAGKRAHGAKCTVRVASEGLTLLLLMLGVLADHHHATLALDDLALFANGFYRGSDFHLFFLPILSSSRAM